MTESSASIRVGDSHFRGFVQDSTSKNESVDFQQSLKRDFPGAAHVSLCWYDGGEKEHFFEEDGEPHNSTGPPMLNAIKKAVAKTPDEKNSFAVVIVRFFGEKLLGVTCGRLSQCYERVTALALHRYLHPNSRHIQDFLKGDKCLYGLAAGDTELILNVVVDDNKTLAQKVKNELEFGGFKGASDETLPRLQNLQASVKRSGVIPVYRYPGNYHGDEWETYEWGPTSLEIKAAVEHALLPLMEQKMNHCVTNLYRGGEDCIDHHSDKDLDLDEQGVIVSVSLGDERIFELRRRANPQDVTRILLPHCSMLVLGPKTNQEYTHAIIKKIDAQSFRISLTMRNVATFLDIETGRLFGQGAYHKTRKESQHANRRDKALFVVGFATVSTLVLSRRSRASRPSTLAVTAAALAGTFGAAAWAFQWATSKLRKGRDERSARDFFSKKSVSGTKY
jgi:alkylated DNA repair dioxygenase AlkB